MTAIKIQFPEFQTDLSVQPFLLQPIVARMWCVVAVRPVCEVPAPKAMLEHARPLGNQLVAHVDQPALHQGQNVSADTSWLQDVAAAHKRTPLRDAVFMSHEHLPRDVQMLYLHAVRTIAGAAGATITVGTFFSGSDIVMKGLDVISDTLRDVYAINVVFKQVFAVEKKPDKAEFIRTQTDAPLIFVDVASLREPFAKDHATGTLLTLVTRTAVDP